MGHWEGPDDQRILRDLHQRIDPMEIVISVDEFVAMMRNSGMIVQAGYYVPDDSELYDMHRWQYEVRNRIGDCRWAMCKETYDALVRRHDRKVAPVPGNRWSLDINPVVDRLEDRIVEVVSPPASLFGTPIRLDPAARSPLFEINSEATR